jgi:hypothetical protein
MLVTLRSNNDSTIYKYTKEEGVNFPHLMLPETWKDERQKTSLKSPLLNQSPQRSWYPKRLSDVIQWLRSLPSDLDEETNSGDENQKESEETIIENNVPSSRSSGLLFYTSYLRESIECIKAFIEV